MTPKPTAELSEILEAIGDVPTDETGVESTFTTVSEIVRRWGRYKDAAGQAYHPMIIVVTDEVGDDENRLEEAIELAAAGQGPGLRPGLAGRLRPGRGLHGLRRPQDQADVSRQCRSTRGRKAPCSSRSACRSGTRGRQYDILEAGLRPLRPEPPGQRHRRDLLRHPVHRAADGVRPDGRMKEYKPDWVRRDQYEAAIARSPLRQAVLNAAQITQQRLPGMPSSDLPRRWRAPSSRRSWRPTRPSPSGRPTRSTRRSGRSTRSAEAARPRDLPALAGPLRPDPGPAAGHEGPLLRVQLGLRPAEERPARSSRTPRPTPGGSSPTRPIQYSEKAAAAAREADRLLHRVIDEHPGHPLGPARPARAQGSLRLQVGRDLRASRPAERQQRRGRRKQEPQQTRGQAAGTAQALSLVQVSVIRAAAMIVRIVRGDQCRRLSDREGDHATWNLRFPAPSSDDVVPALGPATGTAAPSSGGRRDRGALEPRLDRPRPPGEVTGRRMTSVAPGLSAASRPTPSGAAASRRRRAPSARTAAGAAAQGISPAAAGGPSADAATTRREPAAPRPLPPPRPPRPPAPRGPRSCRPRQAAAAARLRHLLPAWSVSLLVHVAILSALAAATFSAQDSDQEAHQLRLGAGRLPPGRARGAAHPGRPGQHPPRPGRRRASTAGPPGGAGRGQRRRGDDERRRRRGRRGHFGSGRPRPRPGFGATGKRGINEGNSLPNFKIEGMGRLAR